MREHANCFKWLRLTFALVLVMSSMDVRAVLVLNNTSDDIYPDEILNDATFLVAEKGQLDIHDLQQAQIQKQFESLREYHHQGVLYGKVIWLRVALQNTSEQDKNYFFATLSMEDIQFFVQDEHEGWQHMRSGAAVDEVGLTLNYHQPLFPFTLPARSSRVLYLKINDAIATMRFLQPRILTQSGFGEHSRKQYLSSGLFIGFMLVLIYYNLVFFVSVKDALYLYYAGYLLSMTSLSLMGTNFIHYLLPDSDFNWPTAITINVSLLYFLLLQFSIRFLNLNLIEKKLAKVVHFASLGFVVFAFQDMFTQITGKSVYGFIFLELLILGATMLLIVGGVKALRKKVYAAKYYLAAVIFIPLTVIVYLLPDWLDVPDVYSLYGEYFLHLVCAWEAILLALALGARIKKIRLERKQAMLQVLELSQQNEARLAKEVKARTADLEEANLQLLAKNNHLDTFARSVAHDLQNPLCTINNYLDIVLNYHQGTLDKKQKDYLDHCYETGLNMVEIIDSLLLLSRVSQQDVRVTRLDMSDIYHNVWLSVALQCEQCRGEVQFPETWPKLMGHGPWVQEMLVNYVSNGLKYGGKPPLVTVDWEDIGDVVKVQVTDNGEGLTPEEQRKLFQPFVQLNDDNSEGHGLGLSIVKTIAEKLGQQVEVESEPGIGSTFGFTLSKEVTTTIPPPEIPENPQTKLSGMTSLVQKVE